MGSKCGACRCIEKDVVREMDRREAAVVAAIEIDVLIASVYAVIVVAAAWHG